MSDGWTDKLSEYLDGELSASERERVEAHLAGCEDCAGTLAELRGVVARAAALEDRGPTGDLWPGIAGRIGAASEGAGSVVDLEKRRLRRERLSLERRFSFSLPQLVAASVVLMFLSGGAAWLMVSSDVGPEARQAERSPGLISDVSMSEFAIGEYGAAIAELEQVIDESREQLDTVTVRVIEENLMTIDRAIAQARRALAQDPASSYLNEYLAGTMRQKLDFLRHAASMAGAAS